MTDATPITIPLINPNEPGALIATLDISPGQYVMKGDKLCTLETTKATVELCAEREGYVAGLEFKERQTIQFGDVLAYLADTPAWVPPAKPVGRPGHEPALPKELRISQAALALAEQYNLDLVKIPHERFVTEKMIQEIINQSTQVTPELVVDHYNPQDIFIYGGGGHGKALIDLVRMLGTFNIVGIVDDGLAVGTTIMGIQVLGGAGILEPLFARGLHLTANAVGGIGNIATRITVFERLIKTGFSCPVLVHPSAVIEPSSTLGEGVQVLPHAYIGSEAKVGYGAIINTGAIVSHDCILGEYANLSPGAILAGEVNIGAATLVGMGATVNLRVKIGAHARIGNGATIKQDVPENGIVRAGTIWPE